VESSSDALPSGRWNTLEMVKAFYGPEDCASDIAEIKFDRPVPIKVCLSASCFTSSYCPLVTRYFIFTLWRRQLINCLNIAM